MTSAMNVLKVSLLFILGFFLVGCQGDTPGGGGGGTGGGTADNPTLKLTSDATVNVKINDEFVVSVTAKKGASPLKAITIYEGTKKVANNRFKIDGKTAAANPVLLFDADKTSFSKKITIKAGVKAGEQGYRVVLTDDASKSAEVKVKVTATGTPPTLTYAGSANFKSEAGIKRAINLSGASGTADLHSLGIKENGQDLPLNRVFIGANAIPSNPFGFEKNIRSFELKPAIVTPTASGTYNYVMELIDKAGLKSTQTFKITVETGTPVDELSEYIVVYNKNGKKGGGLDLDVTNPAAATVSYKSTKAEIIDLGIDQSKPNASNWIQKIKGANNAELRQLVPAQNGLPESFTFETLKYKQTLADVWSKSKVLTNGVSKVVKKGQMYIVRRDGKYYALNVIQVNPTANNNNDNYVFDLKR